MRRRLLTLFLVAAGATASEGSPVAEAQSEASRQPDPPHVVYDRLLESLRAVSTEDLKSKALRDDVADSERMAATVVALQRKLSAKDQAVLFGVQYALVGKISRDAQLFRVVAFLRACPSDWTAAQAKQFAADAGWDIPQAVIDHAYAITNGSP